MPELAHVPVWMDTDDLVSVLAEIMARAVMGDSLEGFFEYEMPDPDGKPQSWPDEKWARGFMVRARYRIGNLQGQGGMRVIGSMQEVQEERRL